MVAAAGAVAAGRGGGGFGSPNSDQGESSSLIRGAVILTRVSLNLSLCLSLSSPTAWLQIGVQSWENAEKWGNKAVPFWPEDHKREPTPRNWKGLGGLQSGLLTVWV